MIRPDKLDIAYIVDDDPTTVELVKLNNERFGFCSTLETFTDPQLAIDTLRKSLIARNSVPQLVLLDINMPVIDGWKFLDQMNDIMLDAGISVVILSSSVNAKDMERAMQYDSVLKYIVKPLTLDKIATMLGVIIKSGRLQKFS